MGRAGPPPAGALPPQAVAAAAPVAVAALEIGSIGPLPAPALTGPRSDAIAKPSDRYPRALWLIAYGLVIVLPASLALALAPGPPRPFVFELGSALGITALSVLALQLVMPARLKPFAPLGADVAVRLHRHVFDVLVGLVAAHVAVVMIADPGRLALLTFFGAPWRAQAAVGSVAALGAIALTSLVRRRLRLSYAGWRGLHSVLAVAALLLAAIHTYGVGRYLAAWPTSIALIALTLVPLGAAASLRGPWLRRGAVRPYRITAVVPEQGGATTLELAADGHEGQPFVPGQFAWIKQAGVRSTLAEHPFSYSSSALAPDRPSFTIQPYGDFTTGASSFTPGMKLLVDGPHGAFQPDPYAPGTVLLVGGIGVTPAMSIIRTADELRDPRPFVIVYSVRTPDRIVFGSELANLRGRLDLTVHAVASAPPDDWQGHRGRISRELLDLLLPTDLRDWQFLVCGPLPFVDACVDALERVGIPAEDVHAERFIAV